MKKQHYISFFIRAAITAILAGQHTQPIGPFVTDTPRKERRRLNKRLKASERWQLDGPTVYDNTGTALNYIASWGKRICIVQDGYRHRFRVLHLDHFGRRLTFILPVAGIDKIKHLPGIDLTKEELQMLLQMADEIGDNDSDQECVYSLKNVLRSQITDRVAQWPQRWWLNSSELLELLEAQPDLLDILVAAADSQLRGLKQLRNAPVGIYNFLLPKGDLTGEDRLIAVLQAAAFSNAISSEPGPIVVQDLRSWRRCYRRLVLISTSRRETVQPVLDDLHNRDRMRKCGMEPDPWRLTLPIIVGRNILCSPFGVDIEMNGSELLAAYHQDLIRTAISKILSPEFAGDVYKSWISQMSGPNAYRLSGFAVWRRTLTRHMLCAWFSDDNQLKRVSALCEATWQQQEAAEQERREYLHRAAALVTTPARYETKIMSRPDSKEDAEDKLSDEFFAFRYSPTAGDDKGRRFLAFKRFSLLRLLGTVNFPAELYDAFLDLCDRNGILDSRDKSVKVGGKTFHGISFDLEKF